MYLVVRLTLQIFTAVLYYIMYTIIILRTTAIFAVRLPDAATALPTPSFQSAVAERRFAIVVNNSKAFFPPARRFSRSDCAQKRIYKTHATCALVYIILNVCTRKHSSLRHGVQIWRVYVQSPRPHHYPAAARRGSPVKRRAVFSCTFYVVARVYVMQRWPTRRDVRAAW